MTLYYIIAYYIRLYLDCKRPRPLQIQYSIEHDVEDMEGAEEVSETVFEDPSEARRSE